jgi:hypothetical protein
MSFDLPVYHEAVQRRPENINDINWARSELTGSGESQRAAIADGRCINSQQKRFHQPTDSTDLEHGDEDCQHDRDPPIPALLILDLIGEPMPHCDYAYRWKTRL